MKKSVYLVAMLLLITTFASADFPVAYDATLDITNKPIILKLKDNNTVTVAAVMPDGTAPKPMRPFNLNFSFKDVSVIKEVYYKTNMTMNMGRYEIAFAPKTMNDYAIAITLPKCGSGRTKWYGEITVKYKNDTTEIRYVFYDVK